MTLIFSCVPPAANWDPSLVPTAKCFSLNTFTAVGLLNTCESTVTGALYAFGFTDEISAVNIATDILFVILPVPVIWGLQLNIRTRITLIGVLSLGTL